MGNKKKKEKKQQEEDQQQKKRDVNLKQVKLSTSICYYYSQETRIYKQGKSYFHFIFYLIHFQCIHPLC
jgi:hypothetical protein